VGEIKSGLRGRDVRKKRMFQLYAEFSALSLQWRGAKTKKDDSRGKELTSAGQIVETCWVDNG